jgi:hypothetical protein
MLRPFALGDVSLEVGLSELFGLFGDGKTTMINAP